MLIVDLCDWKTLSLALRKEHEMRVFKYLHPTGFSEVRTGHYYITINLLILHFAWCCKDNKNERDYDGVDM
jgi:hypothetical protein